jgi:hypothetical protein
MTVKLERTAAVGLVLAGAALVFTIATGLGRTSAAAGQAIAPAWSLTGTWVVTVTPENPPPGVKSTFESLMTFSRDGGMLETSNTGTALRGPAHGAWIRTGPRQFATSMSFFRFDPATGAFLGTRQVHRTMKLSHDQMRFTATSVAEQYNPDGTLVLSGLRATETGNLLVVRQTAASR